MLTLIATLGKILAACIQYAHDKSLMDAGAAQAALKGLKDANDAIANANSARANADSLPIESDPDNTANK